tara:strand:- start:1967 stop:2281 length:315 start_codon:yes stop_codon:yes gene_type:complete
MEYVYIVNVIDRTFEMVGIKVSHGHDHDTWWESQKELRRCNGTADIRAVLGSDYRIVRVSRQSQNRASEGFEVIGQRSDVEPVGGVLSEEDNRLWLRLEVPHFG